MGSVSRREFLECTTASAAAWSLGAESLTAADSAVKAGNLHLAPFRFDVTPPMGHSLCGGWIKSVVGVDDPLEAIGFVLLGAGKPIVLCAVDWTGILNSAHVEWRKALAEACGTTPERVAVQCVHQHNAPFACLDAEEIVLAQKDLPHIVEKDFFRRCLDRGRKAVATAVNRMQSVTHVATGQAKVEKVAANRRVDRDKSGRIRRMRGSSCKVPALRALPQGTIDPWLKTVAFYNGKKKIAACHYYATHPMSYYGDGRVSSDFAGLARKQRQKDEPGCTHLYFTGCAGNIAAGKYNDGSKGMRPILTRRMYQGIVASEAKLRPVEIGSVAWNTVNVLSPANPKLSAEALQKMISNKKNRVVNRNRPSYMLAWLNRVKAKTPIVLSALRIGDVSLLHLPAECFVQYQLRTQKSHPKQFVATAAYGDGGPWYIPIKTEYPHGGYEVSVANCDAAVDGVLMGAIGKLLG
jgi:hypothetical protein